MIGFHSVGLCKYHLQKPIYVYDNLICTIGKLFDHIVWVGTVDISSSKYL